MSKWLQTVEFTEALDQVQQHCLVAARLGWRWWGVPMAHFGAGLVGLDDSSVGSSSD